MKPKDVLGLAKDRGAVMVDLKFMDEPMRLFISTRQFQINRFHFQLFFRMAAQFIGFHWKFLVFPDSHC